MNKISKILKSFALVFVVVFAGISVMACSNSKSKTSAPNATQITDTNTSEENADEINTDNQNQNNSSEEDTTENESIENNDSIEETPVIELNELNGIYKLTKTITFDDADRTNADEVIEYFKTRDFNGVHHVIEKLGYKDYNPIKTSEATNTTFEEMFYFEGSTFSVVDHANNGFYFYNEIPVEASSVISKVEYLEDSDTYVLYMYFSYIDEDSDERVNTPLLFKVPVQKVDFSNDILTGNNYEYKSNTAVVIIDNNDILTQEAYESKLAEIFALEQTENVFDQISAILSSWNYIVSNDTSRLAITATNETYEFVSFCELSNNTYYSIAGLMLKLENHTFNLETKKDEITLSVSIQNNTRLSFTIISK